MGDASDCTEVSRAANLRYQYHMRGVARRSARLSGCLRGPRAMAIDAQARLRSEPAPGASFGQVLSRHGVGPLVRSRARTLQVNVGKLCNQACHHCHVDAGPARVERMERATAERVLELLAHNPGLRTLDLTGGAPELNENFRMLVEGGRGAGREVMVRCNLTVMFEPGM